MSKKKIDPITDEILEIYRHVVKLCECNINDFEGVKKFVMRKAAIDRNKPNGGALLRLAGWLSWAGKSNYKLLKNAYHQMPIAKKHDASELSVEPFTPTTPELPDKPIDNRETRTASEAYLTNPNFKRPPRAKHGGRHKKD